MKNVFNFMTIAIIIIGIMVGTVSAKSLYVNKDLNANSPISAYDIQDAPNYLVYQMTSSPTKYGGSGLGIDTDSEILFVTFEGYGTVDIVDAKTLAKLGTVTAPSATNLAGIVVDQDKQKVYAVDRNTNHLYVYSWNAVTKTLTNDISAPGYLTLPNVVATSWYSGFYGIALDEANDLLYTCDNSATGVKVFNTDDWSYVKSVPTSQPCMGIAIDPQNGFVYTGNAAPSAGSIGELLKYDMNTDTETSINVRTLSGGSSADNAVGIAVDTATSRLYITTGNQVSGGSDRIIVFDSNLNMLHATGDIGNPTGIAIPGKDISYNPLNLQKMDDVQTCVSEGGQITYTMSYDNNNQYDVTNAEITDTIPAGLTFNSATGSYSMSSNTITWDLGTIAAGASGSVQLIVDVDAGTAGTTISNSATIDSTETPPTTQGERTEICGGPSGGNVPEFTAIGAILALLGAGAFVFISRRKH